MMDETYWIRVASWHRRRQRRRRIMRILLGLAGILGVAWYLAAAFSAGR